MPQARVIPLTPTQQVTPPGTWPIPGDVPDLETIISAQAETMAAQAALIDGYQADLNTAQNPPPGPAGTGTVTTAGSSTTLSINLTSGVIVTGAVISGDPGVPAGTVILGQISGTPDGTGSYLASNPLNYATAISLTFTPPPPKTTWPAPTDAYTLSLVQQMSATVLRIQSALIQAYTDLLNTSLTPAPPTGP